MNNCPPEILLWYSSSFLSLHQESYGRQSVPSQWLAQPVAMPLAVVRSRGDQAVPIMEQTSRYCMDVFLHQLHACILLVVTAMARVSAKDLPGQSSSFSAYLFFACLRFFLVVAGQQHSSPAVEWIDALVLSPKSLKFYLHELHTGNRFCWRAKPRERAMLILHRWTYERQGVTGLGRR